MDDRDSLHLAFGRLQKRLEKKKREVARFLKQNRDFWFWMAALTSLTTSLVLSTRQTEMFKSKSTFQHAPPQMFKYDRMK